MAKTRCPDTAAVTIAAHIQQGGTVQWTRDKRPVHQIPRVVDLHAWIPFKCRRRDIVIFADTAKRRVRIKARKDWVLDHGVFLLALAC